VSHSQVSAAQLFLRDHHHYPVGNTDARRLCRPFNRLSHAERRAKRPPARLTALRYVRPLCCACAAYLLLAELRQRLRLIFCTHMPAWICTHTHTWAMRTLAHSGPD
jgi:hypothetical protein